MLPPQEVGVLFDAIRRVRDRGVGVIYVSHRLDEVFAIAARVTVLRDGHGVGTFAVDELDERRLVELMTSGESLAARSDAATGEREDGLLAVNGLQGTVLSGVSLRAHGGEVLGVAGLTGSGREELLPLLFGARVRSGGDVRVDGEALPPGRPSAAIAAGMALVPGDRHTAGSVTSLSVRENLVLTDVRRHASRLGALRPGAERAETRRWITSLDVRPPEPDAPFLSLSGGNQQKIVLAKWLRMRPRVLLLDEPAQGVDVPPRRSSISSPVRRHPAALRSSSRRRTTRSCVSAAIACSSCATGASPANCEGKRSTRTSSLGFSRRRGHRPTRPDGSPAATVIVHRLRRGHSGVRLERNSEELRSTQSAVEARNRA